MQGDAVAETLGEVFDADGDHGLARSLYRRPLEMANAVAAGIQASE
jgi:hypothetical protein